MGGLRASLGSCCGTQAFTRFWGWSQAIGSGFGILGVLAYLFNFGYELYSTSQRMGRILPEYELHPELLEQSGTLFMKSAGLLALLLLGLSTAVLLLVGSYKRKPNMISAWIDLTLSFLCVWTGCSVQYVRVAETAHGFWSGIAVSAVVFIVVGFAVVVVHKHNKDIKLKSSLNALNRLSLVILRGP